jgi:hypothetical protein
MIPELAIAACCLPDMKSICDECGMVVDWSDMRQVGHHNLPGHSRSLTETLSVRETARPSRDAGADTEQAVHFIACDACGQSYDRRELAQVMHHRRPDHLPLQD